MGRFMHPSGRGFSPPGGESAVFQVSCESGGWQGCRISSQGGIQQEGEDLQLPWLWLGGMCGTAITSTKGHTATAAPRELCRGQSSMKMKGSLINKGFLLCCVELCSYQHRWQFSKTEMTVVGCKRDNCQISWDISLPRFSISYLS